MANTRCFLNARSNPVVGISSHVSSPGGLIKGMLQFRRVPGQSKVWV